MLKINLSKINLKIIKNENDLGKKLIIENTKNIIHIIQNDDNNQYNIIIKLPAKINVSVDKKIALSDISNISDNIRKKRNIFKKKYKLLK